MGVARADPSRRLRTPHPIVPQNRLTPRYVPLCTNLFYSPAQMLTDLPNVLTLSRIAAIPLVVALAALGTAPADLGACIVFSTAAITDYFDGKLARSRRQQSDLGRMLDPIADKLLVGAALMMLAGLGRLTAAGLYPAVVIMLREILVSGLREYLAGIRAGLPVTRLAKWKTGFQMGALGTLLAGDPSAQLLHLGFLPVSAIGEAMLWAAAGLTLLTGWDYLTAGLRHAAGPHSPHTGNAVSPPQ
jgi:cardiolipin synthase